MGYRAVFFDLFDTLVRFERDRLPEVQIKGKTVRSTAGTLHAVLTRDVPGVTLEACYDALVASWKEAERLRAIDHREVSARERFSFFFPALGVEAAAVPRGLDAALIEAHRHELAKAASFPAHHRALLERLARRHCLAVVSNFDYSPTALGILDAAGVRDLFSAIVVSDEVGWRKPRPDIFHEALRRTGVEPRATLFVGDRIDIDVAGAHAVGMDAAWINPGREALPAGAAPPSYEIRDLAELEVIVARA
ncbi:MAG TPA: HAD family hydrolase [Candidatus Binatia bacterium]|nr:HAD family hydrolase [Candidatus Binatia bacterium]